MRTLFCILLLALVFCILLLALVGCTQPNQPNQSKTAFAFSGTWEASHGEKLTLANSGGIRSVKYDDYATSTVIDEDSVYYVQFDSWKVSGTTMYCTLRCYADSIRCYWLNNDANGTLFLPVQ